MDGWRRRGGTVAVMVVLVAGLAAATPPSSASAVTARSGDGWTWPVRGPIIRGFDSPSPYGPGHRGMDVAAPRGTVLVAPADGVVTSVGRVGGNRYVTLEIGATLVTFSFVGSVEVRVGDALARGVPVARTGDGHPTIPVPHVHISVRVGGSYVDPFPLFEPLDVSGFIRLVPVID